MKRILCLALLAVAAPLGAQSVPGPVATSNAVWSSAIGYIIKSAEQTPESLYSYKPTPEVRSFGQLIGHVAGAQYVFCAAVLGDKAPGEGDIEKTKTSKADLVAAIRASTEYCKKAYKVTNATAQQKTKLFGSDQTKLHVLMSNATHDAEHYGNIVTYLRMNHIVPPSSQPGQ